MGISAVRVTYELLGKFKAGGWAEFAHGALPLQFAKIGSESLYIYNIELYEIDRTIMVRQWRTNSH